MSQPANGTIRAFEARCRALRGVFLSSFETFGAFETFASFAVVTKL
jgi:hypothetical protein